MRYPCLHFLKHLGGCRGLNGGTKKAARLTEIVMCVHGGFGRWESAKWHHMTHSLYLGQYGQADSPLQWPSHHYPTPPRTFITIGCRLRETPEQVIQLAEALYEMLDMNSYGMGIPEVQAALATWF